MVSEIIKIAHERAPGFASGIATGVSISGPSGDGMVHFTFFRDVLSVTAESFVQSPVESANGVVAFNLTPVEDGSERNMYREDLAVISLPSEAAKGLGGWLNTHFAKIEAK